MAKYCELFYSFFKIGGFTIGGGYAMVPLMEHEFVDRRGWMSGDEFLEYLSLAQSMPGVLAVNMATVVGYRMRGIAGALVSILGNVVLPISVIVGLAIFFRSFRDNSVVNSIFLGIRPAVVALIAAPVFSLAKRQHLTWHTLWMPILAAVLIWLLGISPILVILAAALLGFAYGRLFKRPKTDNKDQ
ncbi:MAG: chromate transporter [Bacteroidales bacterium]|nr:chromate transporter [Bacteroidales bacterium]